MNSPEVRRKFSKRFKDRLTSREAVSVFLILLFLGVALSSIFVSPQLYQWSIHEGDVALKDIYAPYDFKYFWEVDEEATGRAREDASGAVPVVLARDSVSEEGSRAGIEQFFNLLREESEREASLSDKAKELERLVGDGVSEKNIRTLLEDPDQKALREKTLTLSLIHI